LEKHCQKSDLHKVGFNFLFYTRKCLEQSRRKIGRIQQG
jgi:hypothetical protein